LINAQSEVIAWLHNRPNWQQEAADRILKNGSLSSIDIDELTALSKSNKGQGKTDYHKFSGLGASASSSSSLLLKSIGEIEGIENLYPRKPLQFGKKNITVVYGNNGSGKSGYTRILKKVCGKPHAEELKANVFKDPPKKHCCKIGYELAGKNIDTIWAAKDKPIPDLCNIDIFDATSGEFYLVKENEASYTPAILSLFGTLIKTCDAVRDRLKAELQKFPSKLPEIPLEYSGTKAAIFYNNLRSSQTESMLSNILVWTETDDQLLKDLDARLKTEDPKNQAVKKRNQKKQTGQLYYSIAETIDKLTPQDCVGTFKLKDQALEKRKIAIEGAKTLQDLSPLSGVGSDTWRALWYAARDYSNLEAYKDFKFPNNSDDARCVLCQQKLDSSARKRFQHFEEYVTGKLSSDATKAESDYKERIDELPNVPKSDVIQTLLQAAGLDLEVWSARLNSFWDNISAIIKKIKNESEYSKFGLNEKDYSWLEELKNLSTKLEDQAKQLDKDAESFDRIKALADQKELLTKKWTSDQKNAIKAELERLTLISQINEWIQNTGTTQISTQAGVLAKQVITDAYVDRFNKELKNLGAHRIKVEILKTRAPKGHVLHALCLKGLNFKKHPPKNILSEGERRIVALAAFLADVTGSEEKSPFIFDDPISSLDQDFEEKTIDRLVELSKNRQVIIFTHRLSFLGILDSKASPEIVCVRQEPWGTGEPGDVPIYGKKPDGALTNLLNDRLKRAAKILNSDGTEAYYPLAKAICSDFRIIVERIVEFVLLSDVIQRHRREVKTQGKIKGLLKIKVSDCDMIDDLMGRYSCYEHSQSTESPVDVPPPDELEKDIKSLLDWHDEFKIRKVG